MIFRVLRRAFTKYALRHDHSVVHHDAREEAVQLVSLMWPIQTKFPLKRFGGSSDGAYLIPDDLDGVEALFSPGVADVAAFEEQMASRGIKCYLADASVPSPPVQNDRFFFTPKFLGIYDFGLFMTLDHWVRENAEGNSDLVLQMDIEGAEWSVLANASDSVIRRFRIMVIEFHALERILYSSVERQVLQRLLITHHIVHLHVNNAGRVSKTGRLSLPAYLEVTFLRKDRAEPIGYARQFPHPLDIVNAPDKAPIKLPACWYAPDPAVLCD